MSKEGHLQYLKGLLRNYEDTGQSDNAKRVVKSIAKLEKLIRELPSFQNISEAS